MLYDNCRFSERRGGGGPSCIVRTSELSKGGDRPQSSFVTVKVNAAITAPIVDRPTGVPGMFQQ